VFRLARHVSLTMTVGDVTARHRTLILSCDGCGRAGYRIPHETLDKLPSAATMAQIAERTRCSACGGDAGQLYTLNWRSGD
jgi:hypothetical protein